MIPAQPLIERFLDHISPEPMTGCWLWTGVCDEDGYGRMDNILAHRFSIEHHTGIRIPKGKCGLHHCDTPPCVNPAHLYVGENIENVADRVRRGRSASGVKCLPRTIKRGSLHGMSKLTEQDVKQIRAAYKPAPASESYGNRDGSVKRLIISLATQYSVSIHTIKSVVYSIHWRTV